MKWLCFDGAPRVLRGILVYCVFCSGLLRACNLAMILLTNMSFLRNVSCAPIEVVCNLFVILNGVVSTLGSVALFFGSISTLDSDALSFRLTFSFIGDDRLGGKVIRFPFEMLAVLFLLTRWLF